MSTHHQLVLTRVVSWLEQKLAYISIDHHFNVLSYNDQVWHLFTEIEQGESLVGRSITDLLDEMIGLESELTDMLFGRLTHLEIPAVNRIQPDGSINYYRIDIMPIDVNDPLAGILLLINNETVEGNLKQELTQERNQMRLIQSALSKSNIELQRLNHLQNTFLSIVAHDMRSPLTVVRGYADQILRFGRMSVEKSGRFEIDGGFLEKAIATLRDQSLWLSRLVEDILDRDMIEKGKLPVNKERFDFCETGVEIEKAFAFLMSKQDKSVEVILAEAPVWVDADPDRLRQLSLNLVSNSLKFCPEDGGQVKLTIEGDPDRSVARLIVSDNGPGIAKKDQTSLFNPYFRTQEGRKTQGVGLGLFIVKQLVDAHDGTIRIDSDLGRGATFIVELPLQAPPTD